MLAVILLIWQQQKLSILSSNAPLSVPVSQPQAVAPELGPRHQLNYQQWVDILKQEANVAAGRFWRLVTRPTTKPLHNPSSRRKIGILLQSSFAR